MNQSIIRIENLNFAYPDRPLLWQNLSFSLSAGQKIGIWGPNGSGKSTLLNLIMGLLKPRSGQIYLNNQLCATERDFARQRTSVGYAFQDPDDQLFCPTVFEDVAFGPRNLGYSKEQVNIVSTQALALFNMAGMEQHITYHLSGGQKRMLSLACIWAMQPQALLLDEPTLSLDSEHQDNLEKILQCSDLPFIAVSHDRCFLENICNELWVVKEGGLQAVAGLNRVIL